MPLPSRALSRRPALGDVAAGRSAEFSQEAEGMPRGVCEHEPAPRIGVQQSRSESQDCVSRLFDVGYVDV